MLACSALKQRYRDQLRVSDAVRFIYPATAILTLIWERMQARPTIT